MKEEILRPSSHLPLSSNLVVYSSCSIPPPFSVVISTLSLSLSLHLFSLSSNGKRIVVREREDGKCSVQFSSSVLDSGLDLTRDLFLYPFPFSDPFSSSYSFPFQHVDILQIESMYPIPLKFRKHETHITKILVSIGCSLPEVENKSHSLPTWTFSSLSWYSHS